MEENALRDKAAFMAMLANSKKIIDKVETGSFETGHIDSNKAYQSSANLVENVNPSYEPNTNYAAENPNGMSKSHKNLHTSKMDPRIIEAMVNDTTFPEQAHTGPTFSMEDAQKAGFQTNSRYANPTPKVQQPNINEALREMPISHHYNGERIITMTESELDAKIKSALLDFMTTTFTKTLTETTIKKTITTLIKEGKIRVKKTV